MKRTLLTLAAIGTLALTACSSPTAAPGATEAHSPASAATESAEATPAATEEEPTEMPADDDYTTDNPDDYDVGPGDDTTPMTAEELQGDDEPMDGDTGTEAESQNIADYNECVADLKASYEPDTGMTDDTSICDDILQMNNEIDAQFDKMDGLDIPCVYQLEHKRPELFDGRSMDDIVLDPTIIRKCHN